jgi:hypothetical protein
MNEHVPALDEGFEERRVCLGDRSPTAAIPMHQPRRRHLEVQGAGRNHDRVRLVAPILPLRLSIAALADAIDVEVVRPGRGVLRSLNAADVELATGGELLNGYTDSGMARSLPVHQGMGRSTKLSCSLTQRSRHGYCVSAEE